MKNILFGHLLFLSFLADAIGQESRSLQHTYVLQIGKDSFRSQAIMVPNPIYTSKCLKCDSVLETNLLFKDETYSIKIPMQTDTVAIWDVINNKEIRKVDTIDHIQINKLAGTLTQEQVALFLASEIKVRYKNQDLKVERVSMSFVLTNGKQYHTSYAAGEINGINYRKSISSKLSAGSFIIYNTIWFKNGQGKLDRLSGRIAWSIVN